MPNHEVLSFLEYDFTGVKGVNGETEFIPHLAKMGRELHMEKARQLGNLKKQPPPPQELDVEVWEYHFTSREGSHLISVMELKCGIDLKKKNSFHGNKSVYLGDVELRIPNEISFIS